DGLIAAAGIDGATEIYDAFWRSTDSLVADLTNRLQTLEFSAAKQAAHALKGSAANVGAQTLARAATDLETACAAEDQEAASALCAKLADQVSDVQKAFAKLIESRR
ncbi:MAG: Hpt domain-containing protein, partial [Pseudomonadota bacterium]